MYNKILEPLTDVRVSAEMLLSGSLGSLSGDQREGVKQIYTNTNSLYTLFVDVIMAIGLEKIATRSYLAERFQGALASLQQHSQSLLAGVDGPLEEEQVVSVEFIAETTVQLARYVERLWLYSQLENTLLQPQSDAISLSNLLSILQQQIESPSRLAIVVESPSNHLFGDTHYISLMLREVVENALKFASSGTITLNCVAKQSTLEISVSDSGIGIAPIYHTTIFEPFSQVNAMTDGLGLGLYFAQALAALQQVALTLDSRIHHGSTFTFVFPTQT